MNFFGRFWYNGEFKNPDLSITIPIAIILAILAVFFFKEEINLEFNSNSQNKYILKENINMQFSGVVIRKDRVWDNHEEPYFVLNDSSKYYESFLWKKINVGDSLSKKRGDSIVYIYRNKTKFTYDFYEEYKW